MSASKTKGIVNWFKANLPAVALTTGSVVLGIYLAPKIMAFASKEKNAITKTAAPVAAAKPVGEAE